MFRVQGTRRIDDSACCIYCIYMIAKVFKSGNSMALRLPRELNPTEGEMSIEPAGHAWLVEPVKKTVWPREFFEQIQITNPDFKRAPQGKNRPVSL